MTSDVKFRTQTLEWADVVMHSSFYVMQEYLTNVWHLTFTTAATSINMWVGIYRILPIFFLYLADTKVGNFVMLSLSGILSSLGLVIVTVMTREGYKCNKTGQAKCVGRIDKTVFISGMLFIALGRAARLASAKPFISEQPNPDNVNNNNNNNNNNQKGDDIQMTNNEPNNNVGTTNEDSGTTCCCWSWITDCVGTTTTPLTVIRLIVFICMPAAAILAFPFVKKWYYLFGASTLCTLIATIAYLIKSRDYEKPGPMSGRSPITNLLRVFVAAYHKRSQKSPTSDNPLLCVNAGEEFKKISSTRCLGRLHKAALKLDGETYDGGWRLCSVSEVESAKIVIRMVFVYTTFLIGGIVSSVGNTYFVEQALNMNFKIGQWHPPLQLIQILFGIGKVAIELVWRFGLGNLGSKYTRMYTRINAGIGTSLFSIICCTVSAAVERRRVHAVRRRDLVGLPVDGMVHMGAYWLLFQVLFLGFVEAFLRYELANFHNNEAPGSMERYIDCLGEAVVGLGFMWGAFSVFAVSKISGIGSSKSWFRSTLNKSRLDRYYWVLSILGALNICWCIAVSLSYKNRETFAPLPPEDDVEDDVVIENRKWWSKVCPRRSKIGKKGLVAARTWAEVLMS